MEKNALSNLKILDFTTLLPGPFATLMLADMGAEVLKISSKKRGDILLDSPPFEKNTNKSANLLWLNRNKKSISLNLKTKEAVEIVKELVKSYDILVEQFRPGVMEKLGLGYEELKKINPKLIYCSITSYGQTGSKKDYAGHDINFVARSGIMASSGRKSTGPTPFNTQLGDLASGAMHAVVGILASVNYRNLTGIGQSIDISMQDCLIPFNSMDGASFLINGVMPEREGSYFNGSGIYDFYETKDKEYLSIGPVEPKFLKEFSQAIGFDELFEIGAYPKDPLVKEKVVEIIKSKTKKEWEEIFSQCDCCVEPVLNLEEALIKDEHLKEREVVIELEENGNKIKQFAMPIKFSETPPTYNHLGREIGYDTEEIMTQLGYSKEELEELENKNVFE